jgi:LmbE family N-acetylglucosaminyl deacetylase
VPAPSDDGLPLAGTTVLAVFAHPDDESLACGGTLARLSDAGARVVLMCASCGERGALTGPARDNELGPIRVRELRQAAEILGVRDLLIFDHPDGDLRWAEVTDLLAEIVLTLKRFKPAAVITFGEDGLYWHLDHVGVHERTTAAIQLLGADAPPLYYVTMPPGGMPAIVEHAMARGWTAPPKGFWSLAPKAFGLAAEPPTLSVDVGVWTSRKLAAIRCHRSQTGSGDPFAHLDDEDARRWLGVEHFHRASAGSREPVLESILCT